MKSVIVLLVLSNNLHAQTYGSLDDNKGADHGVAKNYSWSESNGIPVVPYVRSEIEFNGQTYSYIRTGISDFKLSRKNGNNYKDIIPKLMTGSFYAMDGYSRLLNVYEDNKVINIYSWGVQGYNFLFYQKRENQEPRLIRFGFIKNTIHSMVGFDHTIQSIEFIGAAQMKITQGPTAADTRKDPSEFNSPGVYEFRTEGVYLDEVFDPSVPDYEPQDVVDENVRKDPQHYLKKQALHAERVASWKKELMDEDAARVAAMPPQPSVNPKPPEPNPEPTVAPSPFHKTPAASTEPESSSNLTPWLAGLVALLVMLLGYLGVRYIRRRA